MSWVLGCFFVSHFTGRLVTGALVCRTFRREREKREQNAAYVQRKKLERTSGGAGLAEKRENLGNSSDGQVRSGHLCYMQVFRIIL